MPAQYMFKGVPDLTTERSDLGDAARDGQHGIEIGMVTMAKESWQRAPSACPGPIRAAAGGAVDPNDIMGTLARMTREYEEFGILSVVRSPARHVPSGGAQRAADVYPIYAKCVELDIHDSSRVQVSRGRD